MTLIYNENAAKDAGIKLGPYADIRKRGMTIRKYERLPDTLILISVDKIIGLLPDYIDISEYCK